MPYSIYDSGEDKSKPKPGVTNIAPGIVTSDCDLPMQGKVSVRIPSIGLIVSARVGGVGGGNGRGFMFFPQPDDEVLVAFNAEDPRDAYVISGLWSNTKRLPGASIPTDHQTKRTIKTGFTPADGHELTFDDGLKTITIRATTGQTITLKPTGIEIAASETTTIKLTAPPTGGVGVIQITSDDNTITLSPSGIDISTGKTINLSAASINLTGTNVKINGANVMVN
jgi:uncharacterized protein involved in type VI secretion and phage assembly